MRCLLLILKHHTIIIVIIIVIVQCNSSCKGIRFITWVHQVVVRDDAVQSASIDIGARALDVATRQQKLRAQLDCVMIAIKTFLLYINRPDFTDRQTDR